MRSLFPLLCCLVLARSVRAEAETPDLAQRIDALAARVMARPVAGISIAVARDGKLLFTRGYGIADLQHSEAVTADTVFHIDSISKNIEAALALQLVEEKKLHLDDDLAKYVTDAPVHGRPVKVSQLLNHTSGIFSFTSLPNADENERLDLDHEQVLGLFRERPPDFEPGTSWNYNNSAFYLAGMVIERVTARDYAHYLREKISEPLGLPSLQLCSPDSPAPHCALGYQRENGRLIPAGPMSWKLPWAAGGICATATDLVRWQIALENGRVVTPATLALMRKPTRLSDGTLIDYGFGTRLGTFAGHRACGHTGGGGGFTNVLESFPDDHLIIAVLTNTGGSEPLALSAAIARLILQLPEPDASRDLPVPKEEIHALTGIFGSDEDSVETFARDGKLRFRPAGSNVDGMPMRRLGPNIYGIDGEGDPEIHSVVRDGIAQWGILYKGGLMIDAKPRAR